MKEGSKEKSETMKVLAGTIMVDKDYAGSLIDDRIYGGFIEHMGRCVYGGIYEPAHPEADEQGFRPDVIALAKELKVPIIRYPGGNFVSGFRWEDSVGPLAQRPVKLDPAWKSIEPNQVGLHEFSRWASRVNADVMMAVNLGTRGAAESAELLEYCNHPGETYWSDLRAKHGQKEPYGFKVWCLGNEMDGPWQICHKSADEYGVLSREAGKLMKRIDASIELVTCGSSGMYLPTYPEWDTVVLDHTYEYSDYLSVHMYLNDKESSLTDYLSKSLRMDEYIRSIIAVCDYVKAKRRSDKTMYLSFDEWNVEPATWQKNEVWDWQIGPALCEGHYSMADAAVFGTMIISLLKHSDRVKIACLAQLVNVFGPIMTERDPRIPAWKQTIYYPFLHASLYGRGRVVPIIANVPKSDTRQFTDVPQLEAVGVLKEDTGELTIFAVNRSVADALALQIDLRGFEAFTVREHIQLSSPDVNRGNSAALPEAVVPVRHVLESPGSGMMQVELEPVSWNVLRFMKA